MRFRYATVAMTLTAAAMTGALVPTLAGEAASPLSTGVEPPAAAAVQRGAHLVRTMGCNDCHTPWTPGPKGFGPDMSRSLNGHPAELKMPAPPVLPPGPWGWVAATTNTAFAGPWGVSFAANLTPDKETGLGDWTEEMFIATMKTGRHQGKGRPLLPPMPYPIIAALDDADIKALFAYLRSLPPVKNKVPDPIDPPEH